MELNTFKDRIQSKINEIVDKIGEIEMDRNEDADLYGFSWLGSEPSQNHQNENMEEEEKCEEESLKSENYCERLKKDHNYWNTRSIELMSQSFHISPYSSFTLSSNSLTPPLYTLDRVREMQNEALAQSLLDRGTLCVNMGRLEEGLKLFDQAIQLNPTNGLIYVAKGKVYEKQGLMHAPLLEYVRGCEMDPSCVEAQRLVRGMKGEDVKVSSNRYEEKIEGGSGSSNGPRTVREELAFRLRRREAELMEEDPLRRGDAVRGEIESGSDEEEKLRRKSKKKKNKKKKKRNKKKKKKRRIKRDSSSLSIDSMLSDEDRSNESEVG